MAYPARARGICEQTRRKYQDFAGKRRIKRAKVPVIGPNGPVAVLDYYNYVMTLGTSRLLIWYQEDDRLGNGLTGPIRLFVIDPALLALLDADLGSLFETMNAEKANLTLGSGPIVEFSLETTDLDEELIVQFPDELEPIEELPILCRSSGIASPDLALLVAKPNDGKYRLYPQDWFNLSDADFGYEWVTRVVRNPLTGHIHGEGFRINPFVLDDTLRSLRGTADNR